MCVPVISKSCFPVFLVRLLGLLPAARPSAQRCGARECPLAAGPAGKELFWAPAARGCAHGHGECVSFSSAAELFPNHHSTLPWRSSTPFPQAQRAELSATSEKLWGFPSACSAHGPQQLLKHHVLQTLSHLFSPPLESLIVLCPSYAVATKTAHSAWAEATPAKSRVGQSPSSAIWQCLT